MLTPKPPRPMRRTLRVLAALLAYPDTALRGHLPEMRDLLAAEAVLAPARRREIDALMATLENADPLASEADYVEMFDRGRSTSLHLFEHVHGDSRDRGPAMIDLGETYAKAGLILTSTELPDYLPAVLEFVSTQPLREARAFLAEIAHILAVLFGALVKRETAYASVVGALIELAGGEAQAVEPRAEEPLDESWAEPVVFDGCSVKGQATPGQAQPIRVVHRKVPNSTPAGAAS
jgi:nitrate reductase delta subunit